MQKMTIFFARLWWYHYDKLLSIWRLTMNMTSHAYVPERRRVNVEAFTSFHSNFKSDIFLFCSSLKKKQGESWAYLRWNQLSSVDRRCSTPVPCTMLITKTSFVTISVPTLRGRRNHAPTDGSTTMNRLATRPSSRKCVSLIILSF